MSHRFLRKSQIAEGYGSPDKGRRRGRGEDGLKMVLRNQAEAEPRY